MTGFRNRRSFILGQAIALPSHTRGGSRMRESRLYVFVRGARGNPRPYREFRLRDRLCCTRSGLFVAQGRRLRRCSDTVSCRGYCGPARQSSRPPAIDHRCHVLRREVARGFGANCDLDGTSSGTGTPATMIFSQPTHCQLTLSSIRPCPVSRPHCGRGRRMLRRARKAAGPPGR